MASSGSDERQELHVTPFGTFTSAPTENGGWEMVPVEADQGDGAAKQDKRIVRPSERRSTNSNVAVIDESKTILEITAQVLDQFMDGSWRTQSHKHLTFRAEVFLLANLDGLCKEPIDLSLLESLDVSCNSLTSLQCIEGTSRSLIKCEQGTNRFSSLQVLKAKWNRLTGFAAMLPFLRELDLSHNALQELPVTAGLMKLEVLILNGNELYSSWGPLRLLQDLKKLDLSDNKFKWKPSQLGKELEFLSDMAGLSLKLKGNPFCSFFPAYQNFVLHKLRMLSRLNNISDMVEARKSADTFQYELRKYDDIYISMLTDKDREDKKRNSMREQAKCPKFIAEIRSAIARTLEDPSSIQASVVVIMRLTSQLAEADPAFMESLKAELNEDGDPAAKIEDLLSEWAILIGRTEGPNARALLLRCICKMTVCHEVPSLAEKAIKLLGWFTQQSDFEENVTKIVQEFLILPLKSMAGESTVSVQHMLRALVSFQSNQIPQALTPIAGTLAKMYWFTRAPGHEGEMASKSDHQIQQQYKGDLASIIEKMTGLKQNIEVAWQALAEEGKVQEADKPGGFTTYQIKKCRESHKKGPAAFPPDFVLNLRIASNLLEMEESALKAYTSAKFHLYLLADCLPDLFIAAEGAQVDDSVAKPLAKWKFMPGRFESKVGAEVINLLAKLMAKDKQVVQDVVEDRHPLTPYLVAAFQTMPCADPALLAASLKAARIILTSYCKDRGHGAVGARQKVELELIQGLDNMQQLMLVLRGGNHRFQDLWEAALAHNRPTAVSSAQRGEENKAPASAPEAPKLNNMREPVMFDVLEAIVDLVAIFAKADRHNSTAFKEVRLVVSESLQTVMYKLLKVPCEQVRRSALGCLENTDFGSLTSHEADELLHLLGDENTEIYKAVEYMDEVVVLLERLLKHPGGLGGGVSYLRQEKSQEFLDSIAAILVKLSKWKAFLPAKKVMKMHLYKVIIDLLKTAGTMPEMRAKLRTENLQGCFVAALQAEQEILRWTDVDVPLERTWTGRSVQMLLMSLVGPGALKAGGKVAYRVVARIADVLEGKSDMAGTESGKEEGLQHFVYHLAAQEAKMWDEAEMELNESRMDDIENGDRTIQQEIFTKNSGIERILMSLEGLFPDQTSKRLASQQELANVESAKHFLEVACSSAIPSGDQVHAVATYKDGQSSDSDSSDGLASDKKAPVLTLEERDFSGNLSDCEDMKHNFSGTIGGSFSILITARWDAFPHWGTLLDFGSGAPQDNIVIANQANTNTLAFEIYRGFSQRYRLTVPGAIRLGQMDTYLFMVSEQGLMRIYRDGEIIGEQKTDLRPSPVKKRKYLYVGKSCFDQRAPFQGRVQELKVWTGIAFEWDQVKEAADSSGEDEKHESLDRRLLMKVLMQPTQHGHHADHHHDHADHHHHHHDHMPAVHGASSLQVTHSSDLDYDEELYGGPLSRGEGEVNKSVMVAAALRCCYAVVQVPGSRKIRSDAVAALRDQSVVNRLLSLVRLCGSPFSCCLAAKLMQLFCVIFEADAGKAEQEVELVATFDMLSSYMRHICNSAVNALKQTDNPELAAHGRLLSKKILHMALVMCKSVPYCIFSEQSQAQASFVELSLARLIPRSLIRAFIMMVMHAPQSGSVEDADAITDLCRKVLVVLLDLCPKVKDELIQILCSLLAVNVSMGPAFMSDLLEEARRSVGAGHLEKTKGFPKSRIMLDNSPDDSGPERALLTMKTEVYWNGDHLRVENPAHSTPCMNFIVTNKGLYIVDPTAYGYPMKNPSVVKHHGFVEITRLVKGHIGQELYLGLGSESGGHEEFMMIICHRSRERDQLLGKLHQLCLKSGFLPLFEDTFMKEVLGRHRVPDGRYELATFVPKDTNPLLVVLTKTGLLEFVVYPRCWKPPKDEDEAEWWQLEVEKANQDAGGDSEEISEKRQKFRLNTECKLEDTPKEVEELKNELLKILKADTTLDKLQKVAFFPDARPKMRLDFSDGTAAGHSMTIMLFDDAQREIWRDSLMNLLHKDATGSWTKSAKGGAALPLKG